MNEGPVQDASMYGSVYESNADYRLWSEGVRDQAGVNAGGSVVQVVVGLVAGGGPGVDVRYVAGVVGVQRDGRAQQVLSQGRERLVQRDWRGGRRGRDRGPVFRRAGSGTGQDGCDAQRGRVPRGERGAYFPPGAQG